MYRKKLKENERLPLDLENEVKYNLPEDHDNQLIKKDILLRIAHHHYFHSKRHIYGSMHSIPKKMQLMIFILYANYKRIVIDDYLKSYTISGSCFMYFRTEYWDTIKRIGKEKDNEDKVIYNIILKTCLLLEGGYSLGVPCENGSEGYYIDHIQPTVMYLKNVIKAYKNAPFWSQAFNFSDRAYIKKLQDIVNYLEYFHPDNLRNGTFVYGCCGLDENSLSEKMYNTTFTDKSWECSEKHHLNFRNMFTFSHREVPNLNAYDDILQEMIYFYEEYEYEYEEYESEREDVFIDRCWDIYIKQNPEQEEKQELKL